ERRLVGDEEASRVRGKRREAVKDPDHARYHRQAVDRQGDAPSWPCGGSGLRIGEHRNWVRVARLRRPEHPWCSNGGEAERRNGGTSAGCSGSRRAYPTPGAERHAQQRPAAGLLREQRPERDARVGLSCGSRVLAVLMAVSNGETGGFVELQSLELPPPARHRGAPDCRARLG